MKIRLGDDLRLVKTDFGVWVLEGLREDARRDRHWVTVALNMTNSHPAEQALIRLSDLYEELLEETKKTYSRLGAAERECQVLRGEAIQP